MTPRVELVVVERCGVRLGVPANRIVAVADLSHAERSAELQQRLGQPPLADHERCFGLRVEVAGGETVVPVAGRVWIAGVPAAEIALLPALFASAAPITAVVFAGDASVLVLDADAMVAHARAAR